VQRNIPKVLEYLPSCGSSTNVWFCAIELMLLGRRRKESPSIGPQQNEATEEGKPEGNSQETAAYRQTFTARKGIAA
jgi:hypothetical protein